MPHSKSQQEYFHQKTEEAKGELFKVGSLRTLRNFRFFNEPIIIAVPNIDKVESFDIWLNNVANIFKTAFYAYKFCMANAMEHHKEISEESALIGFSLNVLASIIYHGANLVQQISDFLSNKEKESDTSIEMESLA